MIPKFDDLTEQTELLNQVKLELQELYNVSKLDEYTQLIIDNKNCIIKHLQYNVVHLMSKNTKTEKTTIQEKLEKRLENKLRVYESLECDSDDISDVMYRTNDPVLVQNMKSELRRLNILIDRLSLEITIISSRLEEIRLNTIRNNT